MGKDGIADDWVGHVAHHGHLQDGHDLTALYAQDSGPQDLVRVGVHDDLHKASRLVRLQRTSHPGHGHLGYADVPLLSAGLPFAQSHPAQLRIDKDRVRHQPILQGRISRFEKIGADDTKIVVGDMGERRAAFHVAQGIDAWHVGLQVIVDGDQAPLVHLDPSSLGVEPVGIGHAADGRQQVGTVKRPLPTGCAQRQQNLPIARPCDAHRLRLEHHPDPVLAQDLCHGFGYVGILAGQQLPPPLHDRHLAAKAAEHLAKLQPDVAAP